MRIVQSLNKHLWYAVDEEGFICFVSLFKVKCVEFIKRYKK